MFLLTKRQEAILYHLLVGNESTTIKKLASQYSLSERMIHYDLDLLSGWLKERGYVLERSKSKVIIQCSERQKQKLLSELGSDDVKNKVLTRENRQEYIYYRLLYSEIPVTSDDLEADIGISKPTVLSDLREVENIAGRYNLTVVSKKGIGYWLAGREIDLRRQLIQVTEKILLKNDIYSHEKLSQALADRTSQRKGYFSLLADYIDQLEVGKIHALLNKVREEQLIPISDSDAFDLFIVLVIMVKRLLAQKTLGKTEILPIRKEEELRLYLLSREICDQLEEMFDIYCGKVELNYVVLTFIGANVSFGEREEETYQVKRDRTVEKMLAVLQNGHYDQITKSFREQLKEDIKGYLFLIQRKRKLHITTRNPLLAQTKAEYPELFEEALKMAEVLSSEEDLSLTHEEVGVLAVYIATYINAAGGEKERRAVIICDEGMGIARLLKNRIQNNILNLKIEKLLSVYEFEHDKEAMESVDFIISTRPLTGVEVPVFCVNPIISSRDIRNINAFVTGRKSVQMGEGTEENYVKAALMNIFSKYIEASMIHNVSNELDYFLNVGNNLVSAENKKLIKEEHAFKTSMIVVKLSDMLRGIQAETGKVYDLDTVIGLTIHIVMSTGRWENKEFFVDRLNILPQEEIIYRFVKEFIKETSEIFNHPIAESEIAAIMRYLT